MSFKTPQSLREVVGAKRTPSGTPEMLIGQTDAPRGSTFLGSESTSHLRDVFHIRRPDVRCTRNDSPLAVKVNSRFCNTLNDAHYHRRRGIDIAHSYIHGAVRPGSGCVSGQG